ncbi:unnamed protein product [Rotaria sp. Silwood1]|nr:unnamed protein product [Rotaria sp. Silwood1]CAF0736703.1 unnamed protein product [Rotaria sp. Silwood1]CAF3326722.1 unnamed protein product [Rotaria sp. Silwood1]CAF4513928.1 unnamed protein product [Rotaria sp. Silwood1]CAF4656384.1 unnamed protein product [Rotaria sp. Silwood1]
MAIDSENDFSNILLDDSVSNNSSLDRNPLYEMNNRHNKSTITHPKPTLYCVVCGDHAFGYNFDAISCESCKAFFRRNALRPPNDLKCRGNGHCEVTVEKRKRCKKCRLDKCFRMGMRKEWILSEQDKQRKRNKIEQNRRQRQTNVGILGRRRRYIKHLKFFEESSSIDEVHPSITNNIPQMNESDWSRIHQVQYAYSQATSLNRVIGVPLYPATQPIHSTLELIRIPTYLASIRLITFMKKIPEFDLFNPEDRVTLVKHNLLAVVFMHVVLLYNPLADSYHEHDTEDPIFQGKDWIEILGEEFYHEVTDVATKLIEIFQYDRVIVKIFLLLILFTKGFCGYDIAHEPSLKNYFIVFNTQNLYLESLYKYCLHHYGIRKTITLFSRSLNQILAIQRLAVHLKDFVHNHINASQLSPLMQSVLQLPNSNPSV